MRMLMCTDTTGTGVAMPLPGWEVATFTSGRLTDHLDGIEIATPHIAGVTRTVLGRSLKLFAENLQRWAAGQPPNWAVNAPAHPRRPDVGS